MEATVSTTTSTYGQPGRVDGKVDAKQKQYYKNLSESSKLVTLVALAVLVLAPVAVPVAWFGTPVVVGCIPAVIALMVLFTALLLMVCAGGGGGSMGGAAGNTAGEGILKGIFISGVWMGVKTADLMGISSNPAGALKMCLMVGGVISVVGTVTFVSAAGTWAYAAYKERHS